MKKREQGRKKKETIRFLTVASLFQCELLDILLLHDIAITLPYLEILSLSNTSGAAGAVSNSYT
jgi:hypothetical protein